MGFFIESHLSLRYSEKNQSRNSNTLHQLIFMDSAFVYQTRYVYS
jgi:hypothetical protein